MLWRHLTRKEYVVRRYYDVFSSTNDTHFDQKTNLYITNFAFSTFVQHIFTDPIKRIRIRWSTLRMQTVPFLKNNYNSLPPSRLLGRYSSRHFFTQAWESREEENNISQGLSWRKVYKVIREESSEVEIISFVRHQQLFSRFKDISRRFQ